MHLKLAQALRVDSSPCIAFTGAGGKTTAMFQLARQLPGPVVITATSHLGAWQRGWADQHIVASTLASLTELERTLKGVTLITGELEEERTKPVRNGLLDRIHQLCRDRSLPLLIEADGSREKPLKAWAAHEPPIPAFAQMVVQVVGLSGLGLPLVAAKVHRPEVFASLSGQAIGEPVLPRSLSRVLTHREGGLKNVPMQARRIAVLNQADTQDLQSAAHTLAPELLSAYHSVLIASLRQEKVYAAHERIAGVILAAGGSTRFGQPKQLLEWRGESFVRTVARRALEAGLNPVAVVTGAFSEEVEAAVRDISVRVLKNKDWQSGQGSSIRTGVEWIMSDPSWSGTPNVFAGGAIFLLADQPQVNTAILRALVEKHAEGLHPIVAPLVMDQRANPVLFDRTTFPDLVTIAGDTGGRAIFHKHRVEYLPWHDDRLLLDVDTPEMYRRLISDESL